MDRAQKEQVLGEIKEAWQNVASVIVADYAGITVPVVTAMRDDFRKNGCHYRVIKNSLVKIAVKGTKMEPLTQLMSGTTAVIWTTGEAPQPPATIALSESSANRTFLGRLTLDKGHSGLGYERAER